MTLHSGSIWNIFADKDCWSWVLNNWDMKICSNFKIYFDLRHWKLLKYTWIPLGGEGEVMIGSKAHERIQILLSDTYIELKHFVAITLINLTKFKVFCFWPCLIDRKVHFSFSALQSTICLPFNRQAFTSTKYSFVLNTSHGTHIQDTSNFPQNLFNPTWSLRELVCHVFQPGLW